MKESCAQETLRPWLIVIIILSVLIFAWVKLNEDELLEAKNVVSGKSLSQGSGQSRSVANPVRARQPQAQTNQAVFTPPWHGPQPLDTVTAATPKRASFNQVILVVSPSVVSVNTSGVMPQGGSGVIVHRQGYILTNHHVIDGAKSIVVTLVYDQGIKTYPAQLIASRPDLDLAVLKITPKAKEVFLPAPLGDSDKIMAGEDILAIGSPFGFSQSASAGIISNSRRTLTAGTRVFSDLIQTDASINSGSSGGPLVNTRAEVIGINSAIYSRSQAFSGIGFAVPINQAKKAFPGYIELVQSPLAGGKAGGTSPGQVNLLMVAAPRATRVVRKAWLGIDTHKVDMVVADTLEFPIHRGVLINRVFTNSPAEKAGLSRGDVISRIDNRPVKDRQMLWSLLAGKKTGDTVKVTVFRQKKMLDFTLILETEPANIRSLIGKEPVGVAAGAAGVDGIEEISWLGVDIQPLGDPEVLQEFGLSAKDTGVLVGEVEGIIAIEAGLEAGDLIKGINNMAVKDIVDFKNIIKKIDLSQGAVLDIVRQNRPFYITIKPVTQDLGAWQ